jgi:hypothetical protein
VARRSAAVLTADAAFSYAGIKSRSDLTTQEQQGQGYTCLAVITRTENIGTEDSRKRFSPYHNSFRHTTYETSLVVQDSISGTANIMFEVVCRLKGQELQIRY